MVYAYKEYKYSEIILKMIRNYIILVLIALVAGYYSSIKYNFFLRNDENGVYIFLISLVTIYYWMVAFRSKFILRLIIKTKKQELEEGENELFLDIEYVEHIFFKMHINLNVKMIRDNDYKAVQFDCREGIMIINNQLKLMFFNKRHCKEIKEVIEGL